jgi:hypothetical protein
MVIGKREECGGMMGRYRRLGTIYMILGVLRYY